MTERDFELSRRRVLGALGTIGVASAGAGLGTSAYFSDQETFQNNRLVAGSLDMKVDWEEHYSDWSDDEVSAGDGEIDYTMSQPGSPGDYYEFPVGADETDLWVNRTDAVGPNGESSLEMFMDNTSLEAYPDADDDGVQDAFASEDVCTADVLADAPDDMDPTANNRTRNQDTYDEETETVNPLINLQDVKPGDFGEVTFSFHLCTNPGYVWMNAADVSAAENGHTEPEAEDDQEEGPADESTTDIANAQVELLDEIQTALWYDDNCNNLVDGEGGGGAQVCAQLVLDSSGSMDSTDGDSTTRNEELRDGAKMLAQGILDANPDNRVGVVDFDSSANVVLSVADGEDGNTNGTPDSQEYAQIETAIDSIDANGGTDIGAGIDAADDDLANCPNGSQRIQIVVTDGMGGDPTSNADAAINEGNTDEIFAVGTGGATEGSLLEFARPSNDEHTFLTQQGESLSDLLSQLGGQILGGEEVIATGSLRETLLALTDGNGIPLDGDLSQNTDFDELTGDPAADARDCFPGNATQCLGFSWWLPVDHANEVQTDSVTFDLGFYAEQCRHNDGSGMNNEQVGT